MCGLSAPEKSMNIVVLQETLPGEARVALMPESVKKLVALKASVSVESGAGLGAARTDDDYREAGAEVFHDRKALLESADVLVTINRPSTEDFAQLKSDAVVLGFLRPLDEPAALQPALSRGLTTFAMELIPRITRAQAMDALSSMATVVGYKAVVDRRRPDSQNVSSLDDCRGHSAACARACAWRGCRRVAGDRNCAAIGSGGRSVTTCARRRVSRCVRSARLFLKLI